MNTLDLIRLPEHERRIMFALANAAPDDPREREVYDILTRSINALLTTDPETFSKVSKMLRDAEDDGA